MVDFKDQLRSDLVEQFKEKPRINALIDVINRQIKELYDFYAALEKERSVSTAVGRQLDGIGDIVCLTRDEAGALACINRSVYVLEDDPYRDYLIYKIWKNTNNCTYYDIMRALRMFWDQPLYYREDPNEPATLIWEIPLEFLARDSYIINRFPMVRAAGVGTMYMLQCNIGIVIETERSSHRYKTAFSGKHECGTVPKRATIAGLQHEELVIETEGTEFKYHPPMNGTVPWRNQGGGNSNEVLEIDTVGHGYGYKSAASGQHEVGTVPWRDMKGGTTHEEIEVESNELAAPYRVPLAGTKPYRSTLPGMGDDDIAVETGTDDWKYGSPVSGRREKGIIRKRETGGVVGDGAVQLETEAAGYQYTVPSSGKKEVGTVPSRDREGVVLAGAFYAEAEGQGFRYRVPWCGTSYCKSIHI